MNLEYKLHTILERNDVREDEKLELIKRNPYIRFEIPSITFGEGRQSRVSALEIIKNDTATQVLWKRCGIEKHLTNTEASLLCKQLTPYRKELAEHGWNVPEIFYSEPVDTSSGTVIFSYEELIRAVDTERMFKDPHTAHFERLSVLQKILSTLTNKEHQNLVKKEYVGHMFSRLPYGIDLKLANLILDTIGKLYFVDFFGPKEIDAQGSWKSYSPKLDTLTEENLMIICATREGCILRMFKLALKNIPRKEEHSIYLAYCIDLITRSTLPQEEKEYILNELQTNFPLLEKVYEEHKV